MLICPQMLRGNYRVQILYDREKSLRNIFIVQKIFWKIVQTYKRHSNNSYILHSIFSASIQTLKSSNITPFEKYNDIEQVYVSMVWISCSVVICDVPKIRWNLFHRCGEIDYSYHILQFLLLKALYNNNNEMKKIKFKI